MAAYIEVNVKGGRRGFVEVGSIASVVTSPGMDIFTLSTEEKPLMLLLRGGASYEVVGESAGKILARADDAKKAYRDSARDTYVDFLIPHDPDRDGTV